MRVGVIGVGDVGAAVIELANNSGHTVTAVADSKSAVVDQNGIDTSQIIEAKQTDGVVGREESKAALEGPYDVLVEATPTTLGDAEPAFSHVGTALQRDRHVVLANKGPVAERYQDVKKLESESEGRVRFGATVGGAIPIVATIEDFGSDQISSLRGVLNGTANFILSRMATEGLDYKHVLAEAQDLGVAEADPSFDVEGTDSGLKGVIIANLLEDQDYRLADASVQGIKDLPGSILDLAKEDGRTIRLVVEVEDGDIRVGPRLVPETSDIAPTGTRNAVGLQTENAGLITLSGRGAGGFETASAVLSDIDRLAE
jgi:homoserine dehydrogenase